MLTRTLLATAAAALISVGGLGVASTPASAAGYVYGGGYGGGGGYALGGFGGNGFYFNFGIARPAPPPPRPIVQRVCQPSYKTITVWDPWYGWVYKTVYAGQVCNFVPVRGYPVRGYPVYRGW